MFENVIFLAGLVHGQLRRYRLEGGDLPGLDLSIIPDDLSNIFISLPLHHVSDELPTNVWL